MPDPSPRDDKSFVDTIKSLISQRRSGAEESQDTLPETSASDPDTDIAARAPIDPDTGSETEFEWSSRGTPDDEDGGDTGEVGADADMTADMTASDDHSDQGLGEDLDDDLDNDLDDDPGQDQPPQAGDSAPAPDNIVNMRGFSRFSAIDDDDAPAPLPGVDKSDAPAPALAPIYARPVPDPAFVGPKLPTAEEGQVADAASGVLLPRDDQPSDTDDDDLSAEDVDVDAAVAAVMQDLVEDDTDHSPGPGPSGDLGAPPPLALVSPVDAAPSFTTDELEAGFAETLSHLVDPDEAMAGDTPSQSGEAGGAPLLLAPTQRITGDAPDAPSPAAPTEDKARARLAELIRQEIGDFIDARIDARLREVLGDDLSRIPANDRDSN